MNFKMLLSAAVATTTIAMAFPANAVPFFPVFTVTPGAGEQGTLNSFQANDLGGQYNEVITFTSGTQFAASLFFKAGQFSFDDTTNPVIYDSGDTGLGSNYGLYATFLGLGNYSTVGNVTNFTLTSGSLSFMMDMNKNSGFTVPGSGLLAYGITNSADDILLGSGSNATGSGNSQGTSCNNNNCGSFGQTTPFELTAAGKNFFTAPDPFYNMVLTSGQFQGINPEVGASIISAGTANNVFNKVPEPSPLALLGLGLVALGFTRRRSGNSKV